MEKNPAAALVNAITPAEAEKRFQESVAQQSEKKDLLSQIMAYESGDQMDAEEAIEFFQELIDSGMAWSLQGHYGRTAQALIDAGECHHKNK